MNMAMQSVQVNHFGKLTLIEHDKNWVIKIYGEPEGLSYEHEGKRGIKNEKHMLQKIQMMDFQAKVSSLLRMSLMDSGTPFPLTGQYRAEVTIISSRDVRELPLLPTLKAVMDGINKQIIVDDSSVQSCSIKYIWKAVTPRSAVTKSPDILNVELFDYNSPSIPPVAYFKSIHMYVVPKVEPIKLDGDEDTLLHYGDDDYLEALAAGLQKDGMHISSGPCKIEFLFIGNVSTKDIDNMARMYYPILEHLGLRSHDVKEIVLTKQKVTSTAKSCVQIVMSPV